MRTLTSYIEIHPTTAPPLVVTCHLHYQLKQYREDVQILRFRVPFQRLTLRTARVLIPRVAFRKLAPHLQSPVDPHLHALTAPGHLKDRDRPCSGRDSRSQGQRAKITPPHPRVKEDLSAQRRQPHIGGRVAAVKERVQLHLQAMQAVKRNFTAVRLPTLHLLQLMLTTVSRCQSYCHHLDHEKTQ